MIVVVFDSCDEFFHHRQNQKARRHGCVLETDPEGPIREGRNFRDVSPVRLDQSGTICSEVQEKGGDFDVFFTDLAGSGGESVTAQSDNSPRVATREAGSYLHSLLLCCRYIYCIEFRGCHIDS